jgi:uncharacterized protein (TIGR00255 family)
MIKSMTGFGAALGDILEYRARLEIKTLNNRFREFMVRVPHFLIAFEEPIKKLIGSRINRGRVEIWLQMDQSKTENGPLCLDQERLREVLEALGKVREKAGLAEAITLGHILRFEGVISSQPGLSTDRLDMEAIWKGLEALTLEALDQLIAMRSNEGQALQKDVVSRLDVLSEWLKELRKLAASAPSAATKRYQARLEELAETIIDPARLAQEAAILAEKVDISEEITRFSSHIQSFRSLLDDPEPVGRRLEFLIQELGREANTMGSKSQAKAITDIVLSFKSELEKIREQALNIE